MKATKRQIISAFGLCLLLLLTALLIVPGSRAKAEAEPHLTDRADIFSADQEAALAQKIKELESAYQTTVVIVTVNELHDDRLPYEYNSITAFAEDYYDYIINGGVEKTGIILCVDMGGREYCIRTTGAEIERFKDAIDPMYERLDPYFQGGDYNGAAQKFLSLVQSVFEPEPESNTPSVGRIAACSGVGLAVSGIANSVRKSKMSNVHLATEARGYAVKGSLNMNRTNENFLYRHTTVTPRVRQQPGGGGGINFGGGHSGISHGGGGGHKF